MVNKNLIVGVHGSTEIKGGQYNVLGSFTAGLLKGFKNIGAKAFTTQECIEQGLSPNVTIGFNATGYNSWRKYMIQDSPNIMWSVDSVFLNNFEIINEFKDMPQFILFNVSNADSKAIETYFPNLKHTNFPHATDLDLWKKQNTEKVIDVVLFASIGDCESIIEDIKQKTDKQTFEFIMELYALWTKYPNSSFWQIYELMSKDNSFDLPLNEYQFVFSNLAPLVSYKKRIQMIQSLKDFNVKVFGNGPWHKYIQGKVEHMGSCDIMESIDIVNKSKIVLHNHPQQIIFGLHERVLNAAATETFILSTQNAAIISEFGLNMDYFDANYENATTLIEQYLKNDKERQEKAKKAREIVVKNHTWEVRAKQILDIID